MTLRLFIDGAAGTTGLEIRKRLAGRAEFSLIALDEAQRKDDAARRAALAAADFAILCLPDAAAVAAVALAEGLPVRIIDASSAHRVAPGWVYGFPELVGRAGIAATNRVSNPGCYATGFLALVAPLVRAGLLPADWRYTVNAVSGFSGGGKALIERFAGDPDIAFRAYGLNLEHKHLAEMQAHGGLRHPPVFTPAVVPAFRGMIVEVPLPLAAMPDAAGPAALRKALRAFYTGSPLVRCHAGQPEEVLLRRDSPPGDAIDLLVAANTAGSQARLIAVFDNLGKGAAGAAVQNLNLMAGLDETAGLAM